MLLVAAVLGGVFFSMYTAARDGIQNSTQELLRRVITSDPRIDQGQTGIMIGGDQMQLPYFTVEVWDDTVYVTGGTYSDLENTEVLRDIVQSCMDQGAETGTVSAYNLRYLRLNNGFFERIAFVDISMETTSLQTMMRSTLQIGAAALVLLLGVSVLLAWWVTRPVERAWKQQHQFLSDASHELKTPLTVILSNAELMDSVHLDSRPARWADNIQSEARQMKSLVEEMLTLARADNLIRTSVFSAVSLSDAATDCALLFEPVAFEVGKTLSYEAIAPNVTVNGDLDKLKQAVSILLDNAIKYGSEGQPIELSVRKTDRHAKLQVSNQGPPIPPEQLTHLFERFYRADASRGEKAGFGLGLSIAQTIAAEHKGVLRAESDDASTRFILTLPLLRK
jgi:signal transduction histidine kinase